MKLLRRASNVECRRPECTRGASGVRRSTLVFRQHAFTLLEVMIAMAVFFIVVFAILNVVVQSLGAARALQKRHADCSIVAAVLTLTNCLDECSASGTFADIFPDLDNVYPDQSWEYVVTPWGTNENLWIVDIAVIEKMRSGKPSVETMQILLQRPKCSGVGVRR
jgi:prepilin-type N-terminal cleavage/methylation domain-containing protein